MSTSCPSVGNPAFFIAANEGLFLAKSTSFCKGDDGETDDDGKADAPLGDGVTPVVGEVGVGDEG